MKDRIRAFSTAPIAQDASALPDSIEWMPAGVHEIQCSLDDEPACVTVSVKEDAVAVLNKQLQEARSLADEGKASRPFIDFGHESGAAAAIPIEFFWQDGIRCRVEWTKAGHDAVEGRVFSYFSPEFFVDKDGGVKGIPTVGPIGALVNTPAFQQIERIAASLTAQKNMQEIAKALGLPETATEAEILAKIAELIGTASSVKENMDELTSAKASLASLQEKYDTHVKASAVSDVERHAAIFDIPEAVRPVIADAIVKDQEAGRKILASFQTKKKTAGAPPMRVEASSNEPKLTGLARAIAAAKNKN